MNKSETVKAVVNAIEAQDWARAASYLTADYTFSGAVPQPISGEQWLGIHRALSAALANFRFNLSNLKEEGSHVTGTVQITGTHTGELRLPIPGIPAIPATGKQVNNAEEPITVTFRDDKIADWHVEQVPQGGLPGILSQLGVALPAH